MNLPGPAAAPAAPSRAVRWVAFVVVPLVLALLLALLAEGAARVRQWFQLGTTSTLGDVYRTDESIGLRVLKPNSRVGPITINSAGFRGPEITPVKAPGTVRVAFLGASTTFCGEVSADAMVWPQLVIDQLRQRFPGTNFDFVNGGVPGYVVASSRKNLQYKVAPFKPDVVVVYHATNDLSGEVRDLAAAAAIPSARQAERSSWLERHSLLWELVLKNLRVRAAQSSADEPSASHLRVDAGTLGAAFRNDLGALLREAGAAGARVAVVTFSTQLRPEQSTEQRKRAAVSAFVYMPFMTLDGLLAGYARYNTLIADAAQAEGALLIGGENRIPGDAAHFVDSVHFTDRGSRANADRVVEALAADAKVRELIEQRRR